MHTQSVNKLRAPPRALFAWRPSLVRYPRRIPHTVRKHFAPRDSRGGERMCMPTPMCHEGWVPVLRNPGYRTTPRSDVAPLRAAVALPSLADTGMISSRGSPGDCCPRRQPVASAVVAASGEPQSVVLCGRGRSRHQVRRGDHLTVPF